VLIIFARMNKKYFPFIALIAAILLFIWVKKNQVGQPSRKVGKETVTIAPELFDRTPQQLIYSKHARCRMNCRHIDESEVREILENGNINSSKIESSSKGISYPLEGKTHDGQKVRIVFSPHGETMVVVTVIDLETEWSCDCEGA
jgi:hypothetical protein